MECNVASADDTVNYLTFFQALREDPVGKNLIISAAVGLNTFKGTDGKPMTDVSAFAEVLYDIGASSVLKTSKQPPNEKLVIMGDDVYGPWSTTAGPNSPLHDTCAPAAQQAGSIEDAVKTWTSAGFPANQVHHYLCFHDIDCDGLLWSCRLCWALLHTVTAFLLIRPRLSMPPINWRSTLQVPVLLTATNGTLLQVSLILSLVRSGFANA